jgi:hypothetical protein
MALKKIRYRAKAVDASRPANADVQYQEVTNEIQDGPRTTKTIPVEGGEVEFRGIDVPDNGSVQGRVLLTLVTDTGQRSRMPAITPWAFKGADTLEPETPEPGEVTVEDDTAEASSEPTPSGEGETEGSGEIPAGVQAGPRRPNPFQAPGRKS